MIYLLAIMAVVLVVVYFRWHKRHADQLWSRYRERQLARADRGPNSPWTRTLTLIIARSRHRKPSKAKPATPPQF